MKIQICGAAVVAVCLSAPFLSPTIVFPQKAPVTFSSAGDESKIEGTWRGESVCVQKGTACGDEIAVYRIAAVPGRRDYLMVTGGKLVDGKEIVMGSGEWLFDREKHTLTTDMPSGTIILKIAGDEIQGTFSLADKTVLRRITLKKSD